MEKMTFEQRSEEVGEQAIQTSKEKALLRVQKTQCQGHEIGRLLAYFRVSKRARW